MKFYKCLDCGEIFIENDLEKCFSCGGELKELVPNSGEASIQKHIPVYKVERDKIFVTVGEILHPMEDNHYIEFIFFCGSNISKKITLNPGEKPEAIFDYESGSKVYAYCNVHGLWMCEID